MCLMLVIIILSMPTEEDEIYGEMQSQTNKNYFSDLFDVRERERDDEWNYWRFSGRKERRRK